MSEPEVSESRRFRTAANHYLVGRPPYSPALVARVAAVCGLGREHRVLDLGCGPAQLAIAFSAFAGEVVAIDPEPEMLRIARDNVAAACVGVTVLPGSSETLGPQLAPLHLVVIGRAFHWMDRPRTLAMLDRIIAADGALALFGDDHPDLPDNAWREAYGAVLDRYAEGQRAKAFWRSPDWVRHEGVLLDSPFCRLERLAVIERRRTPVAHFVDRVLSMSSSSPERLGDRAGAMAAELTAAMDKCARDGLVTEVVESEALLAWRP